MNPASIGSLIRSFVDGVIVLDNHNDILFYDVNDDLQMNLTLGMNIFLFLPCNQEPLVENQIYQVTIKEKKLAIEVKNSQ